MPATLNTTHEQTVRVTGKGETKQKAFANALSHIQKQVVENVDTVTLQITPLKVTPVNLQSQTYRERARLTTSRSTCWLPSTRLT